VIIFNILLVHESSLSSMGTVQACLRPGDVQAASTIAENLVEY